MGLRKTFIKYNPINWYYHRKNIRGLHQNITILASNCLGGLLYHDYGQKFLSPTINTRFDSPDFIKFVLNLKKYINEPLAFLEEKTEPFPVAMIDDIKVYFVHYRTNIEAEKKWKERIKRIDWNNIFILTNDLDGVTDDDLTKLDESEYKNILVLSKSNMPQHRCLFQVKKYANKERIGNVMMKNIFTGRMEIQTIFDFTAWFNHKGDSSLESFRLE